MQSNVVQPALPFRSHTILGVCEAIGEDFGFNPTLLRVPFAATVLFSPTWAVIAYLALGLVVLGSRLMFPKKAIVGMDATVESPSVQPVSSANEREAELPLAA